jgi:hypothetical protein
MVPLFALEITAPWNNTLTLNQSLTVQSQAGANGDFLLTNNATITLGNNVSLWLNSLLPGWGNDSYWTRGVINGGSGSSVNINSSQLWVTKSAGGLGVGGLGTNMAIQGPTQPGKVTLTNMVNNLTLTGASNYIDVQAGGYLDLNQSITANGQQNTLGGIALGGAHTGTLAVQVESGGELDRDGVNTVGVPDQVLIAGAVYNMGGTVSVGAWDMLNITGKDAAGISYCQQTGAAGILKVAADGNIDAAGTYQINVGTVQLTVAGGGTADELDGAGLIFGNTNLTSLTLVDLNSGTPGTVTVQGPVTLAANTTTTENFNGTNNTADLLDVHNGTLTLAGTLKLLSGRSGKPTQPLNFLDDSGNTPAIAGGFASITDDVHGTDTGQVVPNNPYLDYYQVTIK